MTLNFFLIYDTAGCRILVDSASVDTFFDRIRYDEAVNEYLFLLPISIRSEACLFVVHWIPRWIQDDDTVGALQIQTFATLVCCCCIG